MTNPADVDDIVARWRPLSDQETVNAQAFLNDAWALLTLRRPTLEADMAASTVAEANVVRVVCAMVLRVLRNPDGKRTEQIDDYSYTRDDASAGGALTVTPDELASITPALVLGARRNSVRLVRHGDFGWTTGSCCR